MESTQHETIVGMVKIGLAWVGMAVGSVPINAILTGIALFSTICFTWYQIYKLRRDIKREDERRAFEDKLRIRPPHTGPAPL